jgi:tRNA nucleotidyltransferase (CCA-adding enzyme)
MKEAGLYGSSLKHMGFSGYSAETLIDNFGTFEDVIDFFSELKEGDIVDKQGGGKRNKQNAFSIIDPIDPNRDLVSAFSTLKIGKTINVAKKFKETGEIPESKYKEMDSATLSFETDETNEDTLIGQVRKLAKSYQKQLKKRYGFSVKSKEENVNGIKVDVPDFSFDAEWDNDKQKNIVKINFGTDTMTIPENIEKYLPEEANIEAVKKGGKQVITRDGKNYSVEPAKFTSILDAIKDLGVNWEGKLEKTNQNNFIKDTGVVSSGKARFEELS